MQIFPKNIGIIMDGNRRWANKRFISNFSGHAKGAKALKSIVKRCVEINIEQLTVFAFSTENWNRMPSEINSLMKLFENYIKSEIAEVHKNNLVFRVIGNKEKISTSLLSLIDYSVELTKDNTGMNFNVCLDYGGKSDILEAVKSIANKIQNKEIIVEDIDTETFTGQLLSCEIKDLDLLIRTSGETRLSNFMLWQMAYTELYFSNKLWPDFSTDDLDSAIRFYSNRDRRYGASSHVR